MRDTKLDLSDTAKGRLSAMLGSNKFEENLSTLYPGAPTPELEAEYDGYANDLISAVIALPVSATRDDLFRLIRICLRRFETADTEEREQICGVCEDIMASLGIESSDGLLNTWLYGFDPTSTSADS